MTPKELHKNAIKYKNLLTSVELDIKKHILKNFIISDEKKEMEGFDNDLTYCSSVFYQPSDGFVFELGCKNAMLEDILDHIKKYGRITYEEYLLYTI